MFNPDASIPINVVASGIMERERRASDDIAVTQIDELNNQQLTPERVY